MCVCVCVRVCVLVVLMTVTFFQIFFQLFFNFFQFLCGFFSGVCVCVRAAAGGWRNRKGFITFDRCVGSERKLVYLGNNMCSTRWDTVAGYCRDYGNTTEKAS